MQSIELSGVGVDAGTVKFQLYFYLMWLTRPVAVHCNVLCVIIRAFSSVHISHSTSVGKTFGR